MNAQTFGSLAIFKQSSKPQPLSSEDQTILARMQSIKKGEIKVVNMVKMSPKSKNKKLIDLPIKTMDISTIHEEDNGSKL